MIERLNAALSGRYTVERELGEGGMATVYLAEDVRHDRKVALKVLKPELAAVVGAERFLTEIRTTANLQHPGILPLFDSGEADGQLFYVMPFVEGESLRERLDRERQLPVDEAVRIATEVAEALQEAHEEGVVHRDVKPANILLRKGKPLVADFGIALAVSAAGGGRLTETGLSLGTPYYMSPEQASGDRTLTAGTDVYSLGCMLYEMLVGEPPFPGSSPQAVLAKILTAAPTRLIDQRKAVPPNVEGAVLKAIEKLPADRFLSAQEFADALADPRFRFGLEADGALLGGDPTARPWKLATIGLGVLSAALTGVLLSGLTGGGGAERAPRWLNIAPPVPLDSAFYELSPDGTRIFWTLPNTDEGQRSQLWIQDFAEAEMELIGEARFPQVVSPDGNRMARRAPDGRYEIIDLRGRAPVPLADSILVSGRMFWEGDGYIYYSPPAGGLHRINEQGGAPDTILTNEERVYARLVDALPGGRAILFDRTAAGGGAHIVALDLESGEETQLVEGVAGLYSETGHLVYVTESGDLRAAPFDARSLRITGAAVQLASGLVTPSFLDTSISLAANGTLVYSTGDADRNEPTKMLWGDRDGNVDEIDIGRTLARSEGFGPFQLSPDDRRLAFSISGDGQSRLYVKELPDGPTRPLADSATAFSWADSETLVFSRRRGDDEVRSMWTQRADGSSPATVLLGAEDGYVTNASFSPDVEWLVYLKRDTLSNDTEIVARRTDGNSLVTLVSGEGRVTSPTLSPDGRWLAYSASPAGESPQVFVRPFPDVSESLEQVSLDGGSEPRWSRSGDELFYIGNNEGMEITAARYVAGERFVVSDRAPLFKLSENLYVSTSLGGQYDVTSDGSRFVHREYRNVMNSRDGIVMIENFDQLLRERVGS